TLIGAKAKVDEAPARTAISDLRQPHARTIGCARLHQFTAAAPLRAPADRARLRQPSPPLDPRLLAKGWGRAPAPPPARPRPCARGCAQCRGAARGAH